MELSASTLWCVPGFPPESKDPVQEEYDLKDREDRTGTPPSPQLCSDNGLHKWVEARTLWERRGRFLRGGRSCSLPLPLPHPLIPANRQARQGNLPVISGGDSPVQPELQMVFP